MCVHSAGATDLSACHRVNGKKKKLNYFGTAQSSHCAASSFFPRLSRRCRVQSFCPARRDDVRSGKKGDFLSLPIKKKSDVITQSEMLLYSLVELEF